MPEREVFFDQKIRSIKTRLKNSKDKVLQEYMNDTVYTLSFMKCYAYYKKNFTIPEKDVQYVVQEGMQLEDLGLLLENSNNRIYVLHSTLIKFSYSSSNSRMYISFVMQSDDIFVEVRINEFKHYFKSLPNDKYLVTIKNEDIHNKDN